MQFRRMLLQCSVGGKGGTDFSGAMVLFLNFRILLFTSKNHVLILRTHVLILQPQLYQLYRSARLIRCAIPRVRGTPHQIQLAARLPCCPAYHATEYGRQLGHTGPTPSLIRCRSRSGCPKCRMERHPLQSHQLLFSHACRPEATSLRI